MVASNSTLDTIRDAVVAVHVDGAFSGTGFFVLPNTVLTVDYVLVERPAPAAGNVSVMWRDRVFRAEVESVVEDGVALLRVPEAESPMALPLDDGPPPFGSRVIVVGFAAPLSTRLEAYEQRVTTSEVIGMVGSTIEMTGRYGDGMGGSPALVDGGTRVCGVLRTRDGAGGTGYFMQPRDLREQIRDHPNAHFGSAQIIAGTGSAPAVQTTTPTEAAPAEEAAPAAEQAPPSAEPEPVAVPSEAEQGAVERDDSDVDWADDAPATVDLLRRRRLAEVIAQRLGDVDPRTSFLLHIDGAWGTGKSTLLNFLAEELADDHVVVRFDAWQQSRISPPWWALLTATRKAVAARMGRPTPADGRTGRRPRGGVRRGLLRLRGRVRRGLLRLRETAARVRRTGAPYLLALVFLLAVALGLAFMLWPAKSTTESWTTVAKAVTAVLGAVAALWAGALVAGRFLLWDSAHGARLFERSDADPMREVAAHFGWLLERSPGPVIYFIDDLDRCPEAYVVELLDAIQTLVRDAGSRSGRAGKAAHFVVAADGAWLRSSYEAAYRTFQGPVSRPGRPLGYLFLDKLFQLTVPLPELTGPTHVGFLDHLLRVDPSGGPADVEVRAAESRIARDHGDENEILKAMADAAPEVREVVAGQAALALAAPETQLRTEHRLQKFAALLDGNPRTTKRFLSTYSILRCVRLLEGRYPTMEELALWAIIQVRWPGVTDHLRADPDAVRGIAEPLWCAEHFPEDLQAAARHPDLRAVVTCRDGGPLTPAAIRRCCGTADT